VATQPSEILNLVVALGALVVLALQFRGPRPASVRWFDLGFLLLCAGWTATVLEGLVWATALNLAEHVAYAAAGLAFAAGAVRGTRGRRDGP
jgi:hypothetical protein